MLVQVTANVLSHLSEAGVEVNAYEGMLDEVRKFAADGQILWADPAKVPDAINTCPLIAGLLVFTLFLTYSMDDHCTTECSFSLAWWLQSDDSWGFCVLCAGQLCST